jgi:NTP pyrophosphatase (non-canonical NTP hydrolase)
MSDLGELQKRAMAIRQRYQEVNDQNGFDRWNGLDYTAGFVGDVGDLMKLVMAMENKRSGENTDAKLRHELGDCLWSLLIIAEHYGIDLEKAFQDTMLELDERLAA